MSHVQGLSAMHGVALEMTVSKDGLVVRVRSTPAIEKSALSCCISLSSAGFPLTYSRWNEAFCPCAMPAPHCAASVPGLVHVLTPPGFTVQPWLCNSVTAAAGENGYGLVCSAASTKVEAGLAGTGPEVGYADPE